MNELEKPVQNPPLEVIFLTERKDEEQIIAEMQNQIVSQWVYTIDVRGQKVTALSYAGVKEAVRRRGNFRFQPCQCCGKTVHVDEDEKEYRVQVTVHDENRNVMFLGAAQAFKNQPFAWVLAVNKAERNAMRKMLPEKQIALLIEQFLRKDSPRLVEARSEPKTVLGKVGLGPQRLDT